MRPSVKIPAATLIATLALATQNASPADAYGATSAADTPIFLYQQPIVVRFATPEQAQAAQIRILPLPDGKKLAFSTRWDDSNPKHPLMSEALQKHGLKGTFYLNRPKNDDFYDQVAIPLLEAGHSIGSHTATHPHLSKLNPAAISEQIIAFRPELESRLNANVVAFVLPYGDHASDNNPEMPRLIAEAMLRAGHYAAPERFVDFDKRYTIDPGLILPSHTFSADDRKPDAERFRRELAKKIQAANDNPDIPHITFGIHTWQDEEGFKTLDQCFAEVAANKDWWLCNENEYAAYRYQSLHGRIEKVKVEGETAHFALYRPSPRLLGSNPPLSLAVEPAPESLRAEGRLMVVTEAGYYPIYNSLEYYAPVRIDHLKNTENAPITPQLAKTYKFPGFELAIQLDPETGIVNAHVANKGVKPLENLELTLRLPLAYQQGTITRSMGDLAVGLARGLKIDPGEMRGEPEFQYGDHTLVLQADFILRDKPGRVYASTTIRRPAPDAPAE